MHPLNQRSRILIFGLLLSILVSAPWADSEEYDHDLARRLIAEGSILPLAEILQSAEAEGRILDVEFEHKSGRWTYEIYLLRDGQTWEYYFDASNGQLLEKKPD